MEEEQKLDALVDGFRKLDESRKNDIRDLTRKLAEIHQSGEFEENRTNSDLRHEKTF